MALIRDPVNGDVAARRQRTLAAIRKVTNTATFREARRYRSDALSSGRFAGVDFRGGLSYVRTQ
jgi:hypothetical protein